MKKKQNTDLLSEIETENMREKQRLRESKRASVRVCVCEREREREREKRKKNWDIIYQSKVHRGDKDQLID